ncbi:MAG TPA: N-acetylmuramoyl-L-alanine amidase [Longimicrobium sp.]|jgi:N-acetylmuramoyl-L-alanine amidase
MRLVVAILACGAALVGCGDKIPRVDGPLRLSVVHPMPGDPRPPSGFDYVSGSTGTGDATLLINGKSVPVLPNGAFLAFLPVPNGGHAIEATTGSDTARAVVPVGGAPPTPAPPSAALVGQWVRLSSPDSAGLGDGSVLASDVAGGLRGWILIPGTTGRVTAEAGDRVRVWGAPGAHLWVNRRDARPLPATARPGPPMLGAPVVAPAEGWVDVVIPASAPPATRSASGTAGVDMVLHGMSGAARRGTLAVGDPWVREVRWNGGAGVARFAVRLAGPSFGHAVLWRDGKVILRIRRPPRVDRGQPLRGLTIVVDPGHPPGGAVGPTGLREADVTRDVANLLRRDLARRGARVVLTRPGAGAVSLTERIATSRRSHAHAFVSIHVDAVPSGRDPRVQRGTATFTFAGSALPLARAVHEEVVSRLRLPDRGVRRGDFAVLRPTWTPSILCEGSALTLPEDEAALRDPDFRRDYARAIADGLERYFGELGEA